MSIKEENWTKQATKSYEILIVFETREGGKNVAPTPPPLNTRFNETKC